MKSSVIKYLFVFLFALYALSERSFAQYFDSGQDAASLRWQQTRTKHFTVIFPEGFSTEAKRYNYLLENSLSKVSSSLHHTFNRRLPVVIHSGSAISNGMVSWSPRRMEIYPLPPQSNYPQDWMEQLAIHELRHAVQLNKLNSSTAHALNFIFGEQVTSLLTGLYIPSWFLEGDAVVTETALSKSGRGRVPNFEMELRAQFLEHGIYSYDKAVFGSYKNNIPNRYVLGYYLVATGRKLYGKELWSNALEAVSRNPFIPNPFNRGLIRTSRKTKGGLYKQCMQHIDSLWKEQDGKIPISPYHKIKIEENSEFADYHYPAYMEEGSVFACRSSIDDITRFVKIDSSGNISTLFTPGNLNEDALTYSNGRIYWAEYIPDLRWDNRNYSVIKVYDIHTKKLKVLGKKTRWFAPAPSPDAKEIAVVEVTTENRISLLILDSETGSIKKRISSPENYLFMTPAWDSKGERIVTIIQGEEGKAIAEIDVKTGILKRLNDFTQVEISGPTFYEDKVLFLGGYNGIDNVYLINPNNGEIQQITSSRLGAHDAGLSADESKILYVDYTAHGHQIAEASIKDGLFKPLKEVKLTSPRLDSILTAQEGGPISFQYADSSQSIKPYRKAFHLFNLHSWAPAFIDAGNTGLAPGISLMSQNVLSTSFLTLGYQYNRSEETGKYSIDYSYKGFYPVLTLHYSKGIRAFSFDRDNNTILERYTYGEEEISAEASLPLNFSRNKYYRSITPSLSTTQILRTKTNATPDWLLIYDIKSLDLSLTAYNILRYSEKDLLPRWGQVIRFQHRRHLPGIKDSAEITGIISQFFLPGFSRHHSWKFGISYQQKKSSKYYGFADNTGIARGNTKSHGHRFALYSADYVFPLCYPDWSIPRLLYLKRISADVFVDYSHDSGPYRTPDFTSTGAELSAECHLFRFYAPVNLGLRGLYDSDSQVFHLEFMYSFNLASF